MVQIGVYCRPQHRWAHYDRHENGTPMGYCTIKAKRPDRLRYDPQEWSCQPQARTRRPAGLPCPAHNGEARIHGGASSSVDSRLRRVKCSRKYSGKRNPIGASLPRRTQTIQGWPRGYLPCPLLRRGVTRFLRAWITASTSFGSFEYGQR